MKIIKSAIVFKAELPRAEFLAEHLKEFPFEPVGETFISRASFVPNPITGELLTPIEGGVTFTVRYDEKILPPAAVRVAIDAAAAEAEEELGRVLDREERAIIKDRVTADLIAKALVRTRVVNAFYHAERQYLIVPASKALAQIVVGLLIRATGSVKTQTIHVDNVKGGLTARLKSHIDGMEDAFEGFNLGDSCLLKDGQNKASFDLDNLDAARQGIGEALAAGMQVERMELEHGTMAFKLAKDFRLSGIDYFGELTEDEQNERDELDGPMLWRTEAAVQMLQLVAAIDQLCKLFGYKEPEPGAEPEKFEIDVPGEGQDDALYQVAVDFVRESGRASISAIQRKLKIGYNRAARLIEAMEKAGVVTPMNSRGEREIIKE